MSIRSDAKALGISHTYLSRLLNGKDPGDPDNYVAAVTFGFWSGLFDSHYEIPLWHQVIKPVFPNMTSSERRRDVVAGRMYDFRKLRNRIAHHEPIWGWIDSKGNNLFQQHEKALQVIEWINSSMLTAVKMTDRFPVIHGQGWQYHRTALEDMLRQEAA